MEYNAEELDKFSVKTFSKSCPEKNSPKIHLPHLVNVIYEFSLSIVRKFVISAYYCNLRVIFQRLYLQFLLFHVIVNQNSIGK